MIISASRRTDIPAFFGRWFRERLKEGFVEVKNHYNSFLIKKISLQPEDVECFVFWTRNPKSFLKTLPLLNGYPYYFLFTLTPYGSDLEPGVPVKSRIIDTFHRLSDHIGNGRVIWRYDPIIFNDTMDTGYHIRVFEKLSKTLAGHTSKCIISFLMQYQKTIRRLKNSSVREPSPEETAFLLESLIHIARTYDIEVTSCASETTLEKFGIKPNRCVDNELIGRLTGKTIPYSKDKNQRIACGCHESIDIGTYNTCGYGCLYCYARN
jgi:hypothetical protein